LTSRWFEKVDNNNNNNESLIKATYIKIFTELLTIFNNFIVSEIEGVSNAVEGLSRLKENLFRLTFTEDLILFENTLHCLTNFMVN